MSLWESARSVSTARPLLSVCNRDRAFDARERHMSRAPRTIFPVAAVAERLCQGESGSLPDRITPGFSQVGIVSRTMPLVGGIFLGYLPFPPGPFIPPLLHSQLTSPSSALKTSMLPALWNYFPSNAVKFAERVSLSAPVCNVKLSERLIIKDAAANADKLIAPRAPFTPRISFFSIYQAEMSSSSQLPFPEELGSPRTAESLASRATLSDSWAIPELRGTTTAICESASANLCAVKSGTDLRDCGLDAPPSLTNSDTYFRQFCNNMPEGGWGTVIFSKVLYSTVHSCARTRGDVSPGNRSEGARWRSWCRVSKVGNRVFTPVLLRGRHTPRWFNISCDTADSDRVQVRDCTGDFFFSRLRERSVSEGGVIDRDGSVAHVLAASEGRGILPAAHSKNQFPPGTIDSSQYSVFREACFGRVPARNLWRLLALFPTETIDTWTYVHINNARLNSRVPSARAAKNRRRGRHIGGKKKYRGRLKDVTSSVSCCNHNSKTARQTRRVNSVASTIFVALTSHIQFHDLRSKHAPVLTTFPSCKSNSADGVCESTRRMALFIHQRSVYRIFRTQPRSSKCRLVEGISHAHESLPLEEMTVFYLPEGCSRSHACKCRFLKGLRRPYYRFRFATCRVELLTAPRAVEPQNCTRIDRWLTTIYLVFHWLLAVVSCASGLCDCGLMRESHSPDKHSATRQKPQPRHNIYIFNCRVGAVVSCLSGLCDSGITRRQSGVSQFVSPQTSLSLITIVATRRIAVFAPYSKLQTVDTEVDRDLNSLTGPIEKVPRNPNHAEKAHSAARLCKSPHTPRGITLPSAHLSACSSGYRGKATNDHVILPIAIVKYTEAKFRGGPFDIRELGRPLAARSCENGPRWFSAEPYVEQGPTVAERLDCLPPTKANRVQSPAGPLRIFASGHRAGRCRWWADFLGDLPFSPLFHSGAAPYSRHFNLTGSQDLVVNTRSNIFTHSLTLSEAIFTDSTPIIQTAEAGVGNRKWPLVTTNTDKVARVCSMWRWTGVLEVERAKCIIYPPPHALNHSNNTCNGAAVAERLARSPPTKATPGSIPGRVTRFSQVGIVSDDAVGGGFSRGSPVSPAHSFRRLSIFTSITLIGSQDLAVKSRPNLFTTQLTPKVGPGYNCISGLSPSRLKEREFNIKEAGIAAEREWVGMAINLGPSLPP
ncbi:hypothetical protein PR048_030328 [Dryococelus australis]|uniref:Uncharacterized protein n=1 Tax=Dryococelus australis TaxID=614101 RepID=A0ABQ9G960_9NEOP|nr:hypothetical protein PR048_030328 [Dryococelus australis]